jgi:hypothetical protein
MRFVVAGGLGLLAVALMFALAHARGNPLILFGVLGAYFLVAIFLLALGAGHFRRGLALLALDAPVIVAAVIAVLAQRSRMAVLHMLLIALVGTLGSLLGWALAARLPWRARARA